MSSIYKGLLTSVSFLFYAAEVSLGFIYAISSVPLKLLHLGYPKFFLNVGVCPGRDSLATQDCIARLGPKWEKREQARGSILL